MLTGGGRQQVRALLGEASEREEVEGFLQPNVN